MLQKLHSIFFTLLIGSASIIASDFERTEKSASGNQESAQKKSTCASFFRSLCASSRGAAPVANNNMPTAESVAMLPREIEPVENKQALTSKGYLKLWKIFICRAKKNHLEFKNNDQLVVVNTVNSFNA